MARTQKEAINWIKSSVGKGFDTDDCFYVRIVTGKQIGRAHV